MAQATVKHRLETKVAQLEKDNARYRLQLDDTMSPREVDTLTNQLFTNRVRLHSIYISVSVWLCTLGCQDL